MRHHELHIRINGYSTAINGPEACLRAVAHIDYCRRGAGGLAPVVVGKIHSQMNAVDFVKCRIIQMSDKPQIRVLEKIQMDLPNEFTEEQSREVLRRYLSSEIGDSEAVGLAWLHRKLGNNHAHVNIVDGLETKKSAKARAAKRKESGTGEKTRVRRRNHLRYGELFKRHPGTLGPEDNGQKTKAYLRHRWAQTVNEYAREVGVEVHFEHRSLEERGIKFRPMEHEGAMTSE